ncbi:acylneuraminate cytidylyltransferase family protein (plasmid) [Azospirillum sp. HJ39]|uniref:acylneuraminate cytidylyltransferase family protein n=1 Tax=Azospirillum sp. HJ39 TaxID=3159496 RepID=UPI003557D3A7
MPQIASPFSSRLCVICARGGSKGVPGKNIRPLAGRPLIAHTIGQALSSGCFDSVAVSSDSDAILDIARSLGVHHAVRRPAEFATDAAPKLPAIRHCVQAVEQATGAVFGVISDLAVTSPLRAVEDICEAVRLLEESGAGNVVSVGPAHANPYYQIVELDADGHPTRSKPPPRPIFRRQDAPACFELNGAVLVWRRASLFREVNGTLHPDTRAYVMPAERSLDIDSELNFLFAEFLMSR